VTIVVSEQLLDGYAMALYDFFRAAGRSADATRLRERPPTGTCNPWYLATDGRSVMFSKIADDIPLVTAERQANGDLKLSFTGKLGINYQRQRSPNLVSWTDEGAAVAPGDASTTVTVPVPGGPQNFWRFKVNY
jgi:hypothetical protein